MPYALEASGWRSALQHICQRSSDVAEPGAVGRRAKPSHPLTTFWEVSRKRREACGSEEGRGMWRRYIQVVTFPRTLDLVTIHSRKSVGAVGRGRSRLQRPSWKAGGRLLK